MNIENIWKQYRAALKSFLVSKVSNHDDVEDLLQEILIKTHYNIKSLESKDRIKPWLFQIANNAVIDFYRARSRQQSVAPEDILKPEADSSFNKELALCLMPFISALSPESSELLKKIDLEGESQKTYAEDAGISYSTLKSRVQKSRTELRKLFDDCCRFALNKRGEIVDYDSKNEKCC